jgi:hypothetical protein
MTTTLTGTCRSASVIPGIKAERGRLIAVAVRDADEDVAVLAWAAFDSVAGVDAVHVVHCYTPIGLHDCYWTQVTRARDDRRRTANRIAAVAAARVRAAGRELVVDGSALAGPPADVLIELSSVTDVVVVGADAPADPAASRHVARTVQERAECPVVCVPAGYRPRADGTSVVVIADDSGIHEAAMRFAAAYAHRHRVALQVSRTWPSLALATHSGLIVVTRTGHAEHIAELASPGCPTAVVS